MVQPININGFKDGSPVSGATTANLLISEVALADAGDYHLEVTNTIVTGLTISSDAFTVTVEEAPTFDYTFSIDENSANGTNVGTATATDPESDPLTYSILSGNTGNAFTVGNTTGILTVNDSDALDFETTPTFNLVLQAVDGLGDEYEITVTVNLNDVDETPPLGLGDLGDEISIYPNLDKRIIVY